MRWSQMAWNRRWTLFPRPRCGRGCGFQCGRPDANHPYGRGKAWEPLAALAVALAHVLWRRKCWIGWYAVNAIVTTHDGPHRFTLPLLAGVVVVKIWLSRRLARVGASAGSMAMGAEAWASGERMP